MDVKRLICINFTFETLLRMIRILLLKMISPRVLGVMVMSSLAFISCRDGGTSQNSNQTPSRTTINNNAPTTVQGSQNPTATTTNPTATTANTGAAGSEFHYICANNCEGSGANAAGKCPVCGEELVHNTAFHSGDQGSANSAPQIIGADDNFSSKITPLGDPGTSAPATAAPAASGGSGFHYTCSAGCGGGGDAQGACPSCGEALVHNAAYHTGGAPALTPGASNQTRPVTTTNKYPSVFNTPGAAPKANVNTVGASHYICSAGCGGGGNAQGSCPKCGAALVHNDAFH